MNEPRSIHAAEDWGVVLQSVPSKNKKGIVKHLEEIFGLDKHDAEQVLANMPLILVDNISFGLAARIKKFFQKTGAVAETTNHDMIKKNCFQVLWPQTPDLSFFMKNETGPAEAPAPEKKSPAKSADLPPVEKKLSSYEQKPEMSPSLEVSPSSKTEEEPPAIVLHFPKASEKKIPEKTVEDFSAGDVHPPQISGEKSEGVLPAGVDSNWERRAKELNEKLRMIHEEKQELHVRHVEATEKVKSEFQQRIEEEKRKNDEIAKKAAEDLQRETQKHEVLSREGEEWRSKAGDLEEKIRELETNLIEKTSALEELNHQKDEILNQSEKAAEESQQELTTLRRREQEFSRKIEGLEQSLQEMTGSLRSRDGALAQFEKQISELAEKAQGYESIRQEYDAKLSEQEVRLAKAEDDHRRYRSRTDRKNAAATRELGEWIRNVDTLRQNLQKLILFLGSDSAVLDSEKKSPAKSPLTRGPDSANKGKS